MPLDEARYALETPVVVEMATLTGDPVRVSVEVVDVAAARVDLTGRVSPETWARAVRSGAFHVDLEPGEVPQQAGADVEVVVTLRQPLIDRFDDGDELFRALFTEDHAEHGHLLQTDAWLLASAMRDLHGPDGSAATTAGGYRTRWAPPLY